MYLASFERTRTAALLHRFFHAALQVGRMPSLLGREIFRPHMKTTPARAFEDSVVFVCDVERCLRALDRFDRRLVAFCILEDRTEWEAARHFRCSQAYISRRLGETLDLLHETFCRLGLLRPVPARERPEWQCAEDTQEVRSEE
jgi:hypothetical protein